MKKIYKFVLPILVIGAAGILILGKTGPDPERQLHSFLEDVQNENYEHAYAALILPESELLSEQMFEKTMCSLKKDTENAGTAYHIKELKTDIETPDNGGKIFTVARTDEKTDVLCGVYEIFTSGVPSIVPLDLLARDAEMEIWSGGSAYVDDILLNKENCETTQGEWNTHYEIPYLFMGEHQLKFENECFLNEEQVVDVQGNNQYIGCDSFTLREEDQEKIKSGTESLLMQILKNVQDGKPALNTSNPELNNEVDFDLWRVKGILHPESYVVEPDVFTGMSSESPEIQEVGISEIGPYINVHMNFSLDYTRSLNSYKHKFGQLVETKETLPITEYFTMDVVYIYEKEYADWYYSSIKFNNDYSDHS